MKWALVDSAYHYMENVATMSCEVAIMWSVGGLFLKWQIVWGGGERYRDQGNLGIRDPNLSDHATRHLVETKSRLSVD